MLGNEQKIRLLPGDKVQKGKKMKLYIIRHGETSWNKQKKLQGQRDIMLNDAGIRLAELTGEGMKDIDFDLVISSPLIRSKTDGRACDGGKTSSYDYRQTYHRTFFWRLGGRMCERQQSPSTGFY